MGSDTILQYRKREMLPEDEIQHQSTKKIEGLKALLEITDFANIPPQDKTL